MKLNSAARRLLPTLADSQLETTFADDIEHAIDAGWMVNARGELAVVGSDSASMPALPNDEPPNGVDEYDDYWLFEIDDIAAHARSREDVVLGGLVRGLSGALKAMARLEPSHLAIAPIRATAYMSSDIDDELFDIQRPRFRLWTRRGNEPDWMDSIEDFRLDAMVVWGTDDVSWEVLRQSDRAPLTLGEVLPKLGA